MPTPLLDYSVSSVPAPLQVSTTGAITIVANNPGGYSDKNSEDYVDVSSIVFDFGATGSDGSDLTTGAGSTWTVTPPANWTAPSVSGLQFTFDPPLGGADVFPSSGLAFVFSSIPINGTVGTVALGITETASTPGDPENRNLYPAIPRQVGVKTINISKFPADFSVSDLIAEPPNVASGGSASLSWNGSAGAAYVLSYGSKNITKHANGTLLQPADIYPNAAAGDSPLTLEATTIFTLSVSYAPPGSEYPIVFQRQVSVGVYYPNPSIQTLTTTPSILIPSGAVQPVSLNWSTQNGEGNAPVSFTISPLLGNGESGDNFFNTPHTPSGETILHLNQAHDITLTVTGPTGTSPAIQSCSFGPPQPVNILVGEAGSPIRAACSSDGSLAFIAGPNETVYVVDTSDPNPTNWTVAGSLDDMVPSPMTIAATAPYSGFGPFVLDTTIFSPQVSVRTVLSGQPTGNWPPSSLTAPTGWDYFVNVATSPTGAYVFCGMGASIQHSQNSLGGVAIYSVNNADPASWSVICATLPEQNAFICTISSSPDGSKAFVVGGVQAPGLQTVDWKLWVFSPVTGDLIVELPLYITDSPGSLFLCLAIAPDGTFGIIGDAENGIRTLDLSSATPADWSISQTAYAGILPTSCAFSPDGSFAIFASNASQGFVAAGPFVSGSPADWPQSAITEGVGNNPQMVAMSPSGKFALLPCVGDTASDGSITFIPMP